MLSAERRDPRIKRPDMAFIPFNILEDLLHNFEDDSESENNLSEVKVDRFRFSVMDALSLSSCGLQLAYNWGWGARLSFGEEVFLRAVSVWGRMGQF